MGIARKIALTDAGKTHPLHQGRPPVFDAFSSHDDEITELSVGTTVLSGNTWTSVQSVCVEHGAGVFWGLQYHPEYDLHELARLTFCRIEKLIRKGFFDSRASALSYIEDLEALHADPGRTDIAWRLGIDADVMDPQHRLIEVRNCIEHLIIPQKEKRTS